MISFKKLKIFPAPGTLSVTMFYYYIAIISMLSFGGLYLLFIHWGFPIWSGLPLSLAGGLLISSGPILYFIGKYIKPSKSIKNGLKNMGEGQLYTEVKLDRREIFSDIAESVNVANHQLSDKLQSIIKNADRLSAVEHELSSHFKPKNSVDKHTRNLVCQLKISTSRLKNDLSEFSKEKSVF